MLTKHDERKMPKNLGHIESLARSHTKTAIRVLAGIMNDATHPAMSRVAAAKVLLDRGWGKPKEMHHSEVDDNKPLLKVVNEIVHVHETREQIEFKDQTPLLVSVRKHFESFESFVIQSGNLIREGHHRCGRRRTADVTTAAN